MPRISIDDGLFRDFRYQKLIELKGPDSALGVIVRVWIVAQRYWLESSNGIPKTAWAHQGLAEEVIQVGLAEDRGDFIYVSGSEDHFAWLRQKADAGKSGGVKSGIARRETITKSAKRHEAARSGTKPLTTTTTTSIPLSKTIPLSKNKEGEPSAAALPEEVKSPVAYFVRTYVNVYQSRYGPKARPDLRGMIQGQIKRFIAETPVTRACDLISSYLSMDDRWFLEKAHDFTTFISNLSKVGLRLDTGRTMTQTEAKHLEVAATAGNQLVLIKEGNL